ncbi:uncharacterized protein G2W53_037413 [Senna tora]|uniref:Uncharacterized protein n=1 Tax=Senna tora TaxID=362788 RepID=A0A834SUT9_9FABA|nr:uncharacterized protein G2W53_037413 [Senna tora]
MGLVIALKGFEVISKQVLKGNRDSIAKEFKKYKSNVSLQKWGKSITTVSQTNRLAFYFGVRVYLMLEWDILPDASQTKQSLRVVFGNPSGFTARMGLMIALKECEVISKQLLKGNSRSHIKRIQQVHVKRIVVEVDHIHRFGLYFAILVDLMLEWDS